ncbi:MAG: hypothetical protein VR77_11155 [Flavobacteriales bacterium BRH_c54]|nr:MAG: hypothetical protein VR77_11155 [Flavobacteriales bacterium BRH_c54]
MKKSLYSKVLALIFMASMFSLPMSFQSCNSGPKYQKPRNGGAKVNSSGHVGNRKHRNRHVWGK